MESEIKQMICLIERQAGLPLSSPCVILLTSLTTKTANIYMHTKQDSDFF